MNKLRGVKNSRIYYRVKAFLFENTSAGQTVIKNTFWLGVSNIGGRLLRALVIIYAARVLGAAGWGTFSYAITLVAFLTILADFGINSLLTREISRNKDQEFRNRFFATAFFVKSALSVFSILVVLVLGPLFATIEEALAILPIVAFVLIFDNFREFGFAVIRSMERMEKEAALFLFTNLAILGFGFLFLWWSPSVESFAWAYTLGVAAGMVVTFGAIRDYLAQILRSFDRALVKPMLAAAWPFALSGLLGGLMVNTDVIIIGLTRSAAEVGYYSAAQRIILLLYILPAVLATSIFPFFSRVVKARETQKVRRGIESSLRAACAIAFPLAAGGIILAVPLIGLLFGAEYLPGSSSLQILLLTLPLNFLAILLSNLIFAYDAQKKLAIYAATGGILNVIFDLLFIPPWGIAGAAVATLAVQTVTFFYLWRVAKNLQSFSLVSHLERIALATVLMGSAVALAAHYQMHLLYLVPGAAGFYFLILHFSGEPLLKDLRSILSPVLSKSSLEPKTLYTTGE